ncbi:MAG TPA: TIGR03435 family protein [Acidobacteriaceae bacterium]|nr:TIGR03435 family protein [Acidobacteriaceae bacterium]
MRTIQQAAILFIAANAALTLPASAQLAHKGPAANIALSKTVPPYDVVSIKQNVTGANDGHINIDDHGLFTVANMPLFWIIEFAYDVKQDQIADLPDSLGDTRFDITAKVLPSGSGPPPEYPDDEMQARIILMLQDRFHIKAHLEPRIRPVYDLVVAKGGPRIKLSQDEIRSNGWNINGENTLKVLTCKDARMSDLADALSDEAGRKVIDKTGLTGHADITLKWSDDVAQQQGGPDVISIFTAVQDQLGLKLQPSKGPVDTLVIDHATMPTPD